MKKSKKAKPAAKQKLTKSALADALGISRQALNVHLKSPDAPQVDDVDAWQIYLAANGRIGTAPEDLRRAIAEKRLAIMEETRRKQARENEVEAGKLISAEEARQQACQASGYFMSELERWLREVPPALAGKSCVEIAQILRVHIEHTRKELKAKLDVIGN
jgi:hypothetical protein